VIKRVIWQRKLSGPALVKVLNCRFSARSGMKVAITELREHLKVIVFDRKKIEDRIIALQGSLFS
jgi:hypothetical protein